MAHDTAAIDEEWLDKSYWWALAPAEARERAPPPEPPPPVPPPESLEVRSWIACAYKCRISAVMRIRIAQLCSSADAALRVSTGQAQLERARADTERFSDAVSLLKEVRAAAKGFCAASARHDDAASELTFHQCRVSCAQENAALRAQLEAAHAAREEALALRRYLEHEAERSAAAAAAARADAERVRGTVTRQEKAIARLATLLTERTKTGGAAPNGVVREQ
jgi:hypothetical protein